MGVILWTLLALAFGGQVRDLGSPKWANREAATRSLIRYWPLTEPAVCRAERSADPEVSERAKSVRWSLARRPGKRGLYLLSQPFTVGERKALALIADPHELDGLPWAEKEIWDCADDAGVFAAVDAVRRKLRLLPDVDDLWSWPEGEGPFDERGGINGLSGLRFAFRGLPDPRYYWTADELANTRKLWADIKAGR